MRPCVLGIIVVISCALLNFKSVKCGGDNAQSPGDGAAIGLEATQSGHVPCNGQMNKGADVTPRKEEGLLNEKNMEEAKKLAEEEVGLSRPNPLMRRMHERQDSYESRLESYDQALAHAIKLGIPAAIQHVIDSKGYTKEGDFIFIHEPTAPGNANGREEGVIRAADGATAAESKTLSHVAVKPEGEDPPPSPHAIGPHAANNVPTKIQVPEQPPTPRSKLTAQPQHQHPQPLEKEHKYAG